MDCPTCGSETVAVAVPPDYRDAVPGDETAVAVCSRCLSMAPFPGTPPDEPNFGALGDGFPSDPEAGVPMALAIGLLDSLALYRSEIADLLDRVERAGVDPLLVLDRLATDPEIESAVDLAGRRRQLEQLLS